MRKKHERWFVCDKLESGTSWEKRYLLQAFTGVNSSCAKIRNPITTHKTQKTPAAARKPGDRLLVFTALIRLSLRMTTINQTRIGSTRLLRGIPSEMPTRSVMGWIAEFSG